jgi:hypothetical protein
MTDPEVERMAQLLHSAFCEWVAVHGKKYGWTKANVGDFDGGLTEARREAYRSVARAVLADDGGEVITVYHRGEQS